MTNSFTLLTVFLLSFNCSILPQGNWTWQNPLPQGNGLNSVSFIDANNGTAVGRVGTILRTTDGGQNWVSQNSGTEDWLWGVSFTDANTGTAVGDNGIILRTTDGGQNWVSQTSGTTYYLNGVYFTDANVGTAVGYNGIILRTTDGGQNWTVQTSGTTEWLYGVSFTDANTGTVVGGRGTILRTTDGGQNWGSQNSGTEDGLLGVYFTDANTGTAVGGNGTILRTTDGGQSWVSQTSGTTYHLTGVSFTDANTGTAVGWAGTLLRTTDGGQNWVSQTSGTSKHLQGVNFTDANTGTAVGFYGTILRTTDGGQNWGSQTIGTGNSLNGVSFTDENTGTAVGWDGTIVKTTDGGLNWGSQTSGTTSLLEDVFFTDTNNGTAVGLEGTILRTTDGGQNWGSQNSGTEDGLLGVYFTDANTGIAVGEYGTILRTTDGGQNWVSQTSGTAYDLNAVYFTDANNGTAVGLLGTILRTTDGGQNWGSQTSGTTAWLRCVSFTDVNTGTAVGENGIILRTTDGGQSWISYYSDIHYLYGVSFTDVNTGTAVGENGIILRTTDGGQSWDSQNSGTTNFLFGVSFTDVNNGTVVGEFGTILRYNQNLGITNLISPSENQTITSEDISLQWSDVSAESYDVIVDNNSDLSSPEVSYNTYSTEYIIPGYFLSKDTYYWKVIANFSGGSTESNVSYFHYDPPKLAEPHWSPLYRLYKPEDKDHFYCTTPEQRQVAIDVGFRDERIEGHVSAKPFNDPDMVNIFRLYHPTLQAHYYTADGNDKDIKIQNGYTYEGIIGFAYGTNKPELTPLYQLHKDFTNPTDIDHFYTCSFAERDNAVKVYGFSYDGILAYLSPNGDNPTLPVGPGQLEAGLGVNTANGNLRHFTKTSFNIPGKGQPLTFEHLYNSNSVWLYAGITPLSPGWSHTYNSYVVTLNPEEVNQNVIVVWPDGSIHEYYYNGTNYAPQTPGDYDIFNVISAPSNFTIKKKNQTVYTYQTPQNAPNGYPAMLTSIKDRNNNTTMLAYDTIPIVRLKEVTDPSGRKLTFNYYADTGKEYLIKEVVDNAGSRMIQFVYDSLNRLIEYKDAENRSTFYAYDTTWVQDHLLSKITLPRGNIVDFTFTESDSTVGKRVSQQKINGGNTLNYSYNYTNPSATVKDANNIEMRYDYNADGLVTNVLNVALAKGDKFWFQDTDNPTKPTQIQDKNGNFTTFQYDLRGNVKQINQLAGVTITHKYVYDAMNNITKYTDPGNNDTDFSYDGNGNLTSVTDPLGRVTSYTPNSFGKVESMTNPLSHTTNFGYNSYGNLNTVTDPLSNLTTYSYDNISRITGILNANNQNTSYGYDKTDLLLTTTDALTNNTTYSYDANSNLTGILNARGFSTTLGYDDLDRMTSKAEPNSNPTQYSYRDNGQLESRTNPDGSTVTYGYDGSGRLTSVSSSDVNATFQYDGNGNITGVNESGNIKGNGNLSFSYDGIDRLTSHTDFYSKSVSYTYDESSNILSITYPGSKTVTYTYYDDNKLNAVTDWNGKTTMYSYRNDGSLNQITYPNGVVTTYSYDNAERITGITTNGPSGTIANYSFVMDALGNHTQENIEQPLSPVPNLFNMAINYSYSPANRIQNAGNITFDFDANGNTTQRTRNGIATDYEYDAENRLVKVTTPIDTTEYVYDVFGNRRATIKNGEMIKYVLDIKGSMSQVLMETDAAGNPFNYYVYGLGLVCRIKPDGTTRYYHGDFRGSVIAMTDQNGNITHKYAYEPFGKLINKVEQDPNPFQYVGTYGVMNENNGLYFMRARYYNVAIGRFLNEDPIWSTNLFSYCNSNPLSFVDPNGKIIDVIIGALIFSATLYYGLYKLAEYGNDYDEKYARMVENSTGSAEDQLLVQNTFLKVLKQAQKTGINSNMNMSDYLISNGITKSGVNEGFKLLVESGIIKISPEGIIEATAKGYSYLMGMKVW